MKKLFFVAAAVAMFAGCSKNESDSIRPTVDDSAPVAIELGADAPELAVTKTKAVVGAWDDTDVYVFGVKATKSTSGSVVKETVIKGATAGEGQATQVAADGSMELMNLADTRVPYYYVDGALYDFYGYYYGGATCTPAATEGQFTVTFDGSDDIMFALTDKAGDMQDFVPQAGETLRQSDLYSAWAARRSVQPTLKFYRALTRFNFIIQGKGASSADVRIDAITISSKNTGTLTVMNGDYGFVADAAATAAPLSLKKVEAGVETDVDYTAFTKDNVNEAALNASYAGLDYAVTENSTATPLEASLIVAPGMEKIAVTVYMSKKETPAGGTEFYAPVEPYTYEVEAAKDVYDTNGDLAGITEFEAMYQYDLNVVVRGPEAIVITATLTDWLNGGESTYDPDSMNRPGGELSEALSNVETVTLPKNATIAQYESELPATYVAGHPYAEAKKSFPWAGVKFDAVAAGTKIKVTVTHPTKTINLEGLTWSSIIDKSGNTIVISAPEAATYVGFEVVRELGLEAADYADVTVSVEIVA